MKLKALAVFGVLSLFATACGSDEAADTVTTAAAAETTAAAASSRSTC
jgi:hypothetical protein